MLNNANKKKMNQITNHIMMIRPNSFRYNTQTAFNNYYQNKVSNLSSEKIQEKALREFDFFVEKLLSKQIDVTVINDQKESNNPDSIFPNNWISTHQEGSIFLYPMFAENRRSERRKDVIRHLKERFIVVNVFDDASMYEEKNQFLEGTGSMVLDRKNKIAYACLSERTNKDLFEKWCVLMNFSPIHFLSYQTANNIRKPIYHTNVMMSIGEKFAVVCLDSIDNQKHRELVVKSLKSTKKEIINISEDQNYRFAGNILQVMGDQPYLIMSTNAFKSLTSIQIKRIERNCSIIHAPIDTIETIGGGGVRCMMAEIFLKKKS